MNLRQLRYFVTIVDAGSFSRAAEVAHVAQPALSQQIADLEGLLGVSLLQRSARGVRATAAGERLYAEARAILRRIERVPEIVRGQGEEVEGSVRVGLSSALSAVLGGQIMAACRVVLPKVRLKVSSLASMQLVTSIREHTLDLAVLYEDAPLSRCVRTPLYRQRLFLVRRADHASPQATIDIHALADIALVLPSHPNVMRTVVDRVFEQASVEPHIAAETDQVTGILAAVKAGVGDAIMPIGSWEQLSGEGNFASIAIEPAMSITACLVSSAETPLSAASEAVRDFIAAFMARRLREHPVAGAEPIDA